MRISDWSSDVCSSDLYQYESPTQIVDGLLGLPETVAQNLKREVNQLNASFTVALTNGFELGVWGRNLTNAQYLTTVFNAVAQSGSVSGYPSQPRTYGVTGRSKFCCNGAGRFGGPHPRIADKQMSLTADGESRAFLLPVGV